MGGFVAGMVGAMVISSLMEDGMGMAEDAMGGEEGGGFEDFGDFGGEEF